MTDHHILRLFQGETVSIEDYRCSGTENIHDEECALQNEIVFLRRGLFVRRDVSGSHVADASQVLFFHNGQPYEISHPVPGGDCCTIFALAPSVLLEILRSCDPSVDDRHDRPFPMSYAPIDMRRRFLQYRLMQVAFGDLHNDLLAAEENVLMLLGEVIHHTYRFTANSLTTKLMTLRSHQELVDQIKLVLAARYASKPTLTQIADAVHCSPYFLCRIFKQITGVSIHQYTTRVRLLNALEQLADDPHYDLTSIALNLGFTSHSQFTAAFSREFGITPSQFRRTASQRHIHEMSKN